MHPTLVPRLPPRLWLHNTPGRNQNGGLESEATSILVSLESTGPDQRNGASLIFMRRLVIKIQLFLIHVLQKFSFL